MKSESIGKITEIVKLNRSLEKLYDKLAKLEIEHKEDSQEYQDIKSYIEMTLEVIDKKYRTAHFDDEEIIQINSDLTLLNQFDLTGDDFIIDVLELCEENRIRRTCMQLYYESLRRHAYLIDDEYTSPDMDPILLDAVNEQVEEALELEDKILELKDNLLDNTLMDYLMDAISKEKNKTIRKYLIQVKYRLIYMLPSLERAFLSGGFKFTKTPVYQELLRLEIEDEDTIDEFYDDYTAPLEETIKFELTYLASLDKEYLSNTKNKARALLRKLYVRASMSINFDQETEKSIHTFKNKLIEENDSPITTGNIDEAMKLTKELEMPKIY